VESGIAAQDGVSSGKLNANERTSLIQLGLEECIDQDSGRKRSQADQTRLVALLLQFCHEVFLVQCGAPA
jgi:hypothetical protein